MLFTSPLHEEIRALLLRRDAQALRAFCAPLHEADLAAALAEFEPADAAWVLTALDSDQGAWVLSHLGPDDQADIAPLLADEQLARMISHMDADDRVDLVRHLPAERSDRVLHLLAQAEREDIRKLGSYGEGTAGALMTSEYATLSPSLTAREALEKLRLEAPDKETIYYAYVIDGQRRLLGLVSLKDLILARPESRVAEFMHRELITARVDDPQEEVARKLAKYDLIALPVTNGNEALVGIVTFDDAQDVTEAEATTDFHRMGGSVSLEPTSLRDASIGLLVRKRLPWLLVLVVMNVFSGAGIAYFEDTIAAAVALVFFLPLLIDSGGNAGSQSATLMVRALAVGDVRLRDWLQLLGREVFVALVIGLCMGLAVSCIGLFRGGPDIAVVVALTMVVVVLVGSLIGMSLPFLMTRLRLDPATSSAPLVTSLADISGVLIYFSIATWYLGLPHGS
ncbi:magnesium transporter [Geoalkalibacter sp.]|uniref:magnesium transporter n=1 Tax=Geoalkalibacter sp. TaxID=3041440 RepID=UPI00272E0A9F|nr:magnesium transporter [Geoalkalibacter sp.]